MSVNEKNSVNDDRNQVYRAVLDYVPSPIVVWDERYRIVLTNQQVERVFGHDLCSKNWASKQGVTRRSAGQLLPKMIWQIMFRTDGPVSCAITHAEWYLRWRAANG